MLDYLFDKEYREADKKYDTAKKSIKKLQKIKSDIMDDTSSINTINNRIGEIYEDFEKAICVSHMKSRVANKLNTYREPYQSSDGYLTTARDYIDYEINQQQGKMNSAEEAKNTIKRNASGQGGGGGAW